jgi:hypothetical protein
MKGIEVADALMKHPDPAAAFWESHNDALFTRAEVAAVRRCSVALLEREAWSGTGIPIIRDGTRCLYRKRDVLVHLGLASE